MRAIMLDDEIRADFLKWVAERKTYLFENLSTQVVDVRVRWLQGQLQEIEALMAFVDHVMALHKREQTDEYSLDA